jgi:hypothetical protein
MLKNRRGGNMEDGPHDKRRDPSLTWLHWHGEQPTSGSEAFPKLPVLQVWQYSPVVLSWQASQIPTPLGQ